MQVVIEPAEGGLKNLMRHVQRHVGTQIESTPDRRAGLVEVDADAIDREFVPRGPTQFRAWGGVCTEHVATVTDVRPPSRRTAIPHICRPTVLPCKTVGEHDDDHA
ncbi:hypothetical protein MPUL_13070 [Mycolicibacterium pulveris]|uniref:Uncharacterized protein n=1 Tax=Mycolicibacterium pulveris TaxID=36813 RepID=A0A7I7UHI8_MYCPV|nr:hypothetical protein MPUL_13070 [Mycolicibacterium pulveris]